jgi:cytochrome P450
LGHGLVTSEGEVWRGHRDILKPAFDFNALERLYPVFQGASARMK